MSVHDVEEFVELLYRYAETELDQWDNWRLDTGFPSARPAIPTIRPPAQRLDYFGRRL